MQYENGALITDHSSHKIFVVEDGKRQVPHGSRRGRQGHQPLLALLL